MIVDTPDTMIDNRPPEATAPEDFSKAFQEGREKALAEILALELKIASVTELFGLLYRNVNDVTENKVIIVISPDNKFITARNRFASQDIKPFVLALWTPDKNGYPCTISTPGSTDRCMNEADLRKALTALITNVEVAKVLLAIEANKENIEPLHSATVISEHSNK